MKKTMGRPVLPPDKKKVRLHVSVDPMVAGMAMLHNGGISDYFNQLGALDLEHNLVVSRYSGKPMIEVLKDELPDENICVKELD